jgi:pimeloyl-ACP methyl ester carboxylesterase
MRQSLCLILVCAFAVACVAAKRPISHYERNEGKDRVIVFVHGIFGDARDTWTCSATGAYWPKLVLSDGTFNNSDIYVVAYDSPYWGNRMTIDEVVSSVDQHLRNDKVFSHREVVFVAHSLGGLVVQRLLLTHRDYGKQVPFIFFYSTPEEGSEVARLGSIFSADPLLKEMFSGDENGYLLNLEDEWIAAGFSTARFCAYETKPIKNVMVVTRLSGTRNCTAETPVPISEDHIGIVKPCSTQADSYIALKNAFVANPIAKAAPTARKGTAEPTRPSGNAPANRSTEPRKDAIASPAQVSTAFGGVAIQVQPGGAASVGQTGGLTVGQIINPPTRIALNCVPSDTPFIKPAAYLDGRSISRAAGTTYVVVHLSDLTKYRGAPDGLKQVLKALGEMPNVEVFYTTLCGYTIQTSQGLRTVSWFAPGDIPKVYYFDKRLENLAGTMTEMFLTSNISLKPSQYIKLPEIGNLDQIVQHDFWLLSGIDIEVVI